MTFILYFGQFLCLIINLREIFEFDIYTKDFQELQ